MFVLNINTGKKAAGLKAEKYFPKQNLGRGVVRTNEDATACWERGTHHLNAAEVIREKMAIIRNLPAQELTTLRFGPPTLATPSIHAELTGVWCRSVLLDREKQFLDDAIALAEIWGKEARNRD
jgi:hypothetical protein